MADSGGQATHSLEWLRALREEPYKFGFFQTLRRLECIYAAQPRFGKATRVSDDPIRLGQQPSMAFAPATFAEYAPGKAGCPARLLVYFLGLFGPNGPLPLHLTDYARDRMRNADDPTLARFADIFHHRMLHLFYRAWADAQPTVNHDRPGQDRFFTYLGSLFGLGMEQLQGRDALPDHAKLYYAGQFVGQTRSASGLCDLLKDYFGLTVSIEEFVGQWLTLPSDSHWRLGESPDTGSLGQTIIMGERVWECQQKFRIRFGPMGIQDYERLLPGGASLERLVALIRMYVGDAVNWDVNLILNKAEIPPLQLGGGARLGWTTWLTDKAANEDAGDLYLEPVPCTG